MKNQVNNEKGRLIKGKSTRIAAAFIQNKANFKNIKIGVSSFETSIYEILSAWRGKKQTQNKPNSNPIPERPKMNVNIFDTKAYNNFLRLPGEKTKPIQTQTNPISTSHLPQRAKVKHNYSPVALFPLTSSGLRCYNYSVSYIHIVKQTFNERDWR